MNKIGIKMKNKKALRIIKYVASGLWWAIMLIGAFLIISFVGAHMRGDVPRIGNYSVMNIVSESMEPTIERGSYILIKQVDSEDVKKGDVICFYSTDPNIYGCPNTHRVVEEPYIEDGELKFVTQGDRNLIADSTPAEGDRLIGIYVKNLTVFTKVLSFVSANMPWLLGGLLVVNAVVIIGGMFLKGKNEINEKPEKKAEK